LKAPFLILLAAFTAPASAALLPQTEVVLQPGEVLEAQTDAGSMKVTAKADGVRIFTFGDDSTELEMTPRPKRWYGSLGLYSPEKLGSPKVLVGGKMRRPLIQEYRMDFPTKEKAIEWLNGPYHRKYLHCSPTGLAVGWYETPSRNQLNVDIVQVTVLGQPATGLKSALPTGSISIQKPKQTDTSP